MFVGGTGDERVGRRSARRAGCRTGLCMGWQAGPSVNHERASRRVFVGGAGDERVGRCSAGRAGRRAGLRTGWQAGPSVTHERASRRAGLRSSQMAGLSAAAPPCQSS